jgi:hypothetical protein
MKKLIAILTLMMMGVNIVSAGELDLLVNKLADKGVITYGEAQTILIQTKEETRKELAKGQIETLPLWIQNLAIKGDLRLRYQEDTDKSKNFTRQRERLRLRLGFETRVIENVKAGFGLATGQLTTASGDVYDKEPTSTNYTFGNGFSKPTCMVDYGFLEYTPYNGVVLTGGKMKAGTQRWQASDLLWDTDVNPDGVALNLNKDVNVLNSAVNLFFNTSWLILNELNADIVNPEMYIFQPGFKISQGIFSLKAAVALENFNVINKNTGYYGTPTFDYKNISPSVELGIKEIGKYCLNIFGDTTKNTNSKVKTDKNASAYGLRFGDEKIQKFGNWQLTYMLRKIEKNAWLNKLGDSDAYGGENNSKGYEGILNFGLTSNTSLALDYYSMDKIIGKTSTTKKTVLQVDVVCKF